MQILRNLTFAALLAVPLLVSAGDPTPPKPSLPTTVNINTADAGTLAEMLVGVGDARAKAIIEFRDANGPFTSADQLVEVKGIGNSVVEKNRDRIRLK